MLLRVAVVAALLACLHAAPALAAPTVTIDSGPDGPTNESSPTFGFTVENATAVECSVDQGTEDFGPCTTATSHTDGPLADGDWTFRVRAADDVPETTTQTRDFAVDTEAPSVTLDAGGPTGPTNDPQPSFSWTAAGDDESLRECSLDSGTPSFAACTTSTQYDQATPLDEGSYTFRIRVEDEAGNTATDTRDFSVDTVGPLAEVTGPKRTGERKPSFEVSSPEAGASLTCKIDGKPAVGCGPSFVPDRRLKYGAHELLVIAHDTLGNPGPPRTFRFKVLWPPLTASRAGRTVATALRRHKFAKRVIDNLEQTCSWRGLYAFSCRFSSAFPGYSLKGHGPVELRRGRISYRFVVRAQGERIVLTDENEGRFPG
jgi:Bacterial Ig-like domain